MPLDALGPELGREAARRTLAAAFRRSGIESADIDARLLVCAAVGIDHVELIRAPDAPLAAAAGPLADYAARRLRHEPVSRLVGRREFWGVGFAISAAVLDPRPETEGLVGSVLDAVGARRGEALRIVDLGTGSGAILGALLLELPHAVGIGIDSSIAACRVARRNLETLDIGRRASIVCANWAAALTGRFDIIASNPPYVSSSDLERLGPEVRDYDPLPALDGGPDGLEAYRAIVVGLRDLLEPSGVVAFECGESQGESVGRLFRDAGLPGPAVYKDLAGKDRVVIAQNVV